MSDEPFWKSNLIGHRGTIGEAIRVLDANVFKICLVVDDGERLVGTITDGDVRRGILRSLPFEDPVTVIMKKNPVVGSDGDGKDRHIEIMRGALVHHLPIVDGERRVRDLVLDNPLAHEEWMENWVVLMAGGLGSRLNPMTESTPKPLLKVGEKPLLDTIVEKFTHQGFRRFYISVNYKGKMVKRYFGDGSRWNADIRYLEEDERLGTAGAIGLLPGRPTLPVIVMNGDVLTSVNFRSLLEFHEDQDAQATMTVREYDFQVPFGVVGLEGSSVLNIEEKPVHRFFVNAGIYVIEPEVLETVPPNVHLDMPDLFRRLVGDGKKVSAFPIREYWLDIGQIDNLEQANREFPHEFSN